jgi:osmotically-inducible protein OsmY
MLDDKQLKVAILAELNWEPSVNAAHIGVTTRSGVVTLSGDVETFAEKRAAESATRRVKGVRGVAQELEVKLPFAAKRGDDSLATAALDRLAWESSVPHAAIKVKVEKGWLTLDGEVDWHFQKEAAERVVRNLSGVIGVSNKIQIKPRLDVSNVSDSINHALHRSWFFDPAVAVSADGGRVHLTGTVNSPHDRQVAGATAWAAPGVTSVVNDIIIT